MSRPTSFRLRTQSRPPKLVTQGLLSLAEHLDHIDLIPGVDDGNNDSSPNASPHATNSTIKPTTEDSQIQTFNTAEISSLSPVQDFDSSSGHNSSYTDADRINQRKSVRIDLLTLTQKNVTTTGNTNSFVTGNNGTDDGASVNHVSFH